MVFIGLDKVVFKDQLMVFIGLDKGTVKNRAQFSNKCSGLKLFIVYDNTKMVSISLTFKWFR